MELQELVERIHRWKLRQTGEVTEDNVVIGETQDMMAASVAGEAAEQLAFEAEQHLAESVESDNALSLEDAYTEDEDAQGVGASFGDADDDMLSGETDNVDNDEMETAAEDESVEDSASLASDADEESEDSEMTNLENFEDNAEAQFDAEGADSSIPLDLAPPPVPPVPGAEAPIVETTQEVEALEIVDDEK